MSAPPAQGAWERVYTIHDWYDGPRAGFGGVPHAYLSTWSNALGGWEPHYRLWPVDAGVMALALEDWAITERWQLAFYGGAGHDTRDPLPADRARAEDIAPRIEEIFENPPAGCRLADADFQAVPGNGYLPFGMIRPLVVRWMPVG